MSIPTQDQQQERELLGNIQRNLDDDAPRLAYADWLRNQDTGDGKLAARGEFIRVQCALADAKTDITQQPTLRARQDELLNKHYTEWVQPLRTQAPKMKSIDFKRGFIDRITIRADDFARHGEQIFSLAPTIREACLEVYTANPREARAVAASPYLENLTSLKLNSVTTEQLLLLVFSPHLGNLTSLDVSCDDNQSSRVIDAKGAQALARALAPSMRQLTSLNLDGQRIGSLGLRELVCSGLFSNLQSLSVRDNNIKAEGARALASSPYLERLTSLNLSANKIGAEGMELLAGASCLANLKSLGIGGNDIRPEGARALAESPYLTQLTSLNLNNNHLCDEGIRALAASPNLSHLTVLELADNFIGDAGARALGSSPHLGHLTNLILSNNTSVKSKIGNDGARALAASPYLANVRSLDLSHNTIDAEGAQILAHSPHLTQLTSLDLGYSTSGYVTRYEGAKDLLALRSGRRY